MAVLTEHMLRVRWKKDKSTRIQIEPGTKITPSAREFINQKNIKLVIGDSFKTELPEKESSPVTKEKSFPYVLYENGACLEEKPETMTALFGNQLVYKDFPRIKLRGTLDSLESEILYTIGYLQDWGTKDVLIGLKELYQYVRNIMRAEVRNENLNAFTLLHYNSDEVRKMTHNPMEAFGKDHIILNGEESLEILMLNRLRTKVREVEVLAVEVFRRDKICEREDIVTALNRLSSGFYFLMFKSENKKKPSRIRNW
ncbi:MAG: cobalamin adenosyltransferase [Tissierellia bacterium]|nr:cobalamin adenosyltransferase [Tissierellia bacterium]